ncbi:MAG TPA: hypothetical protein PKC30_14765 [Saprospiraceae bacterium]|nr:hypothetical protein [Saprospiraceae bacterium]
MKTKFIFQLILLLSITLTSCESKEDRQKRIARDEQRSIELEEKRKAEEAEQAFKLEQKRIEQEKREEAERVAREARLETERQEKAIYDRYINNTLNTGSRPYSYCYGRNLTCSRGGCSEIKVITPRSSDVLVTIKQNDNVVSHAFIRAGSSYIFDLPNGTYQAFFYYGKGWNPEKFMKQTVCGPLKGGFISNEVFGKDNPDRLYNNILTYELILQPSGNFSTRPSNANEAL